jgi:hypothetical protein
MMGWIGEHLDDMTVYDLVLLCSYGGGGNWRWWMETALQKLLAQENDRCTNCLSVKSQSIKFSTSRLHLCPQWCVHIMINSCPFPLVYYHSRIRYIHLRYSISLSSCGIMEQKRPTCGNQSNSSGQNTHTHGAEEKSNSSFPLTSID